jgi:hypothetical protein
MDDFLVCDKSFNCHNYPLVDTHSQTIPNFVNMKQENRNIKISRVAAKTAIRVFMITLFFGVLPFIVGNQSLEAKVATTHLYIQNKWTLVYPGILLLGFLVLAIICRKKKYQETDFNWLLVLNTIMLVAYLVMLYSRIFKAVMI